MQASPSNKIYTQALEKLKSFSARYSSLKSRSADELAKELSAALSDLKNELGGPSLKYQEIEYGSVPNSFEFNQFLESLVNDINMLIDESDIVRAATINTHNFIKTEILKSEEENSQLHNKLKTLQLYSSSEDKSILYAGDYFYNDDNIDWDKTPMSSRLTLAKGNDLSLGISSQVTNISSVTRAQVLDGSNGFIGNNQEAIEYNDVVVFFSEGNKSTPAEKLSRSIDNTPNTTLEFEKYLVPEATRIAAKDFNFAYKYTGDPDTEYLESFANESGEVDWADGLEDGVLRLNLMIDLGVVKRSNLVTINPYTLTDNVNGPILIKSIRVSRDQSSWSTLKPENVWLTGGIDQNTINLDSENIIIGQAQFRVDSEEIRYLIIEIEQPHSLDVDIGHLYYTSRLADEANPDERFEGPIPLVDQIWREREPNLSFLNDLVQRRELLSGKRWAIGIRDINVLSTKYIESGYMISNKILVPGGVDRVALEADIDLPDSYPTDRAWVRFFVSPDDGRTWHQISRIQDDFFGVPEIIAYNDTTPQELRIPGVKYYEVSETPTSLRFKIEMDRNFSDDTLTPTVSNYRLKIKQRDIL